MERARPYWFDSNRLLFALAILAALPLLSPAIPPLTDLPGHMARYRIALDLHHSPYLHLWYDFRWVLFGNLGVDLLIVPMSKLFGLELGTKLIVLAIPPLTVAGMLYMAREVHGRIPATVFFALPLAYGHPFQFGFVNFTLSMALAFLAAGLWLHLGRLERLRLRGWLFALISPALFLAHVVGWAIFGVVIFTVELMRRRQAGQGWLYAARRTVLAMLPLTSAFLLILLWWGHDPAGLTALFPWHAKLVMLMQVLKDRFELLDVLSALLLYTLVLLGTRRMGFALDKGLGLAALFVFFAFLAMPSILKGVSYADMRLIPYFLAIAVLALSPLTRDPRWHHAIALAGLIFFASRIGAQTWSYWAYSKAQQQQLAAIDRIDRGARVLVLVDTPCRAAWDAPRSQHLGSMATVRREAYTNGMWPMPGGRLMTITYDAAGPYTYSASQALRPARCRDAGNFSLAHALEAMRSGAFDYLWMIDAPARNRLSQPWLKPVWVSSSGALYRVDRKSLTLFAHKG